MVLGPLSDPFLYGRCRGLKARTKPSDFLLPFLRGLLISKFTKIYRRYFQTERESLLSVQET